MKRTKRLAVCLIFHIKERSSLIYNTSPGHELHECDTSDTIATRVTRVRNECDTSATHVRHECYTNDMSAARLKNF